MIKTLFGLSLFAIISYFPIYSYAENTPNTPDTTIENSNSKSDSNPIDKKLTDAEIEEGLKAILREGVAKAVAKLAVKGGFNENGAVKIELPRSLHNVKKVLDDMGYINLINTYTLRLNVSAEKSAPKVGGYFIVAINQFKIKDPEKILQGSDDAATKYLKKRMSYGLAKVTRPIIRDQMKLNGVYSGYDQIISIYRRVPYEPNVRSNIESYMEDKILDAFFLYIAEEERLIRNDPKRRTDEAIKKIFP